MVLLKARIMNEIEQSPNISGNSKAAVTFPFRLLIIVWSLLIAVFFVWNLLRNYQQEITIATMSARDSCTKDLLYRRWAARHGGVYVPVSADTPPNPFLEHVTERDITTPSGRRLTLMNPAYMTRQVHEMAQKEYSLKAHITSLRPIRPQNAPDAWETQALSRLSRKKYEIVAMEEIDGLPYLRLMRALITEQSCLVCHAQQGYKVGDIRGGLSVSVPWTPHKNVLQQHAIFHFAGHFAIWLLGAAGIVCACKRMRQYLLERERAAEEKWQLECKLQQAQKMESIGLLAGGVAHDFNNMLGAILGHAEVTLEQLAEDHPLHANVQEIRKAAERSVDITRQLLAFARKQSIAPKVMDLNAAVAGMLKMLQRLIGENIRLNWHPAADLWPVKVDASQIDQILANLCINSRDAIADVGNIDIATANVKIDTDDNAHKNILPGEYVELTVGDNGCGMSQETMSHMFEPFFTTKSPGKGTGLGLPVVYGAVRQNNGFLDVHSAPGAGTRFTIYLPRYSGSQESTTANGAVDATPRGHETILLVEDDANLLKMTRLMLEKLGYAVLAANTPGEAICLAIDRAGAIDLLLTDVVMPEMSGKELSRSVVSFFPHVKCLFMSGYSANIIAQHGVLDEGVHFIAKPFSTKSLAAKIREVLEKS